MFYTASRHTLRRRFLVIPRLAYRQSDSYPLPVSASHFFPVIIVIREPIGVLFHTYSQYTIALACAA
ncbi:hypothetical protein MCEGEM3_00547 [Oxalobacteraceae bacterium]